MNDYGAASPMSSNGGQWQMQISIVNANEIFERMEVIIMTSNLAIEITGSFVSYGGREISSEFYNFRHYDFVCVLKQADDVDTIKVKHKFVDLSNFTVVITFVDCFR